MELGGRGDDAADGVVLDFFRDKGLLLLPLLRAACCPLLLPPGAKLPLQRLAPTHTVWCLRCVLEARGDREREGRRS